MNSYQVIFQSEPEGGYTVTVPSLPGCVSYGETIQEARVMIADAIRGYVVTAKKHGFLIDTDATEVLLSTVRA